MNKQILVFFGPHQLELYTLEKRPFSLIPITDIDILKDNKNPVIGVISAQLVSSHSRQLPPKHKRYLHRALPFMLEDDIAMDIETQHVATQINGSQVRALVINKQNMQSLMQQVEDIGISLHKLYVDADLIPITSPQQKQSLQCFNDCYLAKSAEGLLAYMDNINQTPNLETSDVQRPDCSRQQFCAQALARATETLQPALNLLQGEFAAENIMVQRSVAVNRALTGLAVITVIQVFYWAVSGSHFHEQAELIEARSVETYRNYFPNDKTIIDIQRQARGHINKASANGGDTTFLVLMTYLGQAISQTPQPNNILLKSMQWQRRTAELIVEIDAKTIAELASIESRLKQKQQLTIDLNQVNQRNNIGKGVTGRLRLSALQTEKSP